VSCHHERAVHVGVDHQAPRFRCDFPEARRFGQELIADVFHAATGIVHQNIESPEPLDRGFDNLGAVAFLSDVGDQRENPRFAAALPNLFRDGFDLAALARRGRDDMDSGLRKS
jgi:hypothetical protein